MAIRPPKIRPRCVISLGDGAPSNFVMTTGARLRAIDEDRLDLRPAAFDLARVVTQWSLGTGEERALITAYREAGADPSGFERDRRFWLAVALSTSAAYRLTRDPDAVAPVARRLTALAHNSR